jgi:hypothetical protein
MELESGATTDSTLIPVKERRPRVATLVIKTADELKAVDSLERQAARRAARERPLVRHILNTFVERGGPIPLDDIIAASPDTPPEAIHDALIALDEKDLIRLRAGHVDLAYPFSAAPTPFLVGLPGGRERYTCCAMDALGIPPMVGQAVEIRSQCYHCGASLEFSAAPHGVGPDAVEVMVWFGERGDERCKVADSL